MKQRQMNVNNNAPSTDSLWLNILFVLAETLDKDNKTVGVFFVLDVSIMSDTEHLISTFQKSNETLDVFFYCSTLIS